MKLTNRRTHWLDVAILAVFSLAMLAGAVMTGAAADRRDCERLGRPYVAFSLHQCR